MTRAAHGERLGKAECPKGGRCWPRAGREGGGVTNNTIVMSKGRQVAVMTQQ